MHVAHVMSFPPKRKQLYVWPILTKYIATLSFDLWMLNKHIKCVLLLLTSLKMNWQPKHITINLFEKTQKKVKLWQEIQLNCHINMG
jgi:hypothetical protein